MSRIKGYSVSSLPLEVGSSIAWQTYGGSAKVGTVLAVDGLKVKVKVGGNEEEIELPYPPLDR